MRREDFPILNEQVHGRQLVYLDNAATTQKPQVVIDAIAEAYSHWNANVHRGVHHLSQVATQNHEEARKKVAKLIHAQSEEEIIFTKGTTDSINMLARSFGDAMVGEGDEIIVSQLEHHSNIVPWQMLCERKGAVLKVIPLREDLSLDIEAFKGILNKKTRLVSVAHVSNVLGIVNPIKEIVKLAHEKGIAVCVDGAQSVPHLAVDVQKLDCDFLVFSAHKMYGPTGLGVLYGKKKWLDKLPPAEGGGEMIEHVSFEKTTYNVLPYKFEAGTPLACARRIISSTGFTMPKTLLTCATETKRVLSLKSPLNASISSDKSSRKGMTFSVAFLRSQSICQGTIFEWCSSWLTIISSPSCSIASPKLRASILRLSVVPLVKIISSEDWA